MGYSKDTTPQCGSVTERERERDSSAWNTVRLITKTYIGYRETHHQNVHGIQADLIGRSVK